MKTRFWIRCLSVALIFAPLLSVGSAKVLAVDPVYQAQVTSAYNQYMQLGYAATAQRNYPNALTYFKQALRESPGDKYAVTAVNNIQYYIQRGRQASLAFIGIPGRRVAGASRGGDGQNPDRPIALIPTNTQTDSPPQLTTAAYPTFFIYVPQSSAQALEFVLKDDTNGKLLYKATFKPNVQSGIVSISLPANSNLPSLETDKDYTWAFSTIYDPQNRALDLKVEGLIKRILPDPNLTIQLQKAQPQERASLYATSGFWQDTLGTLADLRRLRPSDTAIKTDWEDLLKSVGLGKIAQAPLLPCCTAQK